VEYAQAWNFFDKIYCISVNERTDRRKTARREFAKVGLLNRVEFVLVAKHPVNPEQGIYESHILCMRKALEAGAETILLFEDDIIFHNFSPKKLQDCCAALQPFPDWNALFLGCMVSNIEKTFCKKLIKIRYQCLTHGYALTSTYARHLAQIPWQGIPYDGLLKNENNHFFAMHPMPAFQSNSPTDNQTLHMDRMRRVLGGLQRLQLVNEWFHLHKKTIIIAHVAGLILAGMVFLY
jgi:GR25 family glycosyltransferase involved in LPS biosynthesis